MLNKALEWVCFHRGHSFLRAFDIKRYIIRVIKMPCKWVSLSIGALLGNLEGIPLPGCFKRKGSFLGPRGH
jgi:hypothetical protein